MNCVQCNETLPYTWKDILFGRRLQRFECTQCARQYRVNLIPLISAAVLAGVIRIGWSLVLSSTASGIVWIVTFLGLAVVFQARKPWTPVTPVRQNQSEMRWYQSPIPYMTVGFLVVILLMFAP